ncbi:unannotated protein [freshwater metagenome]|uniref:Unannotated protein n=1 Tax=freshwater metagenome TaxID=449393 RepID=A0A6J7UMT6_9ZZZZ
MPFGSDGNLAKRIAEATMRPILASVTLVRPAEYRSKCWPARVREFATVAPEASGYVMLIANRGPARLLRKSVMIALRLVLRDQFPYQITYTLIGPVITGPPWYSIGLIDRAAPMGEGRNRLIVGSMRTGRSGSTVGCPEDGAGGGPAEARVTARAAASTQGASTARTTKRRRANTGAPDSSHEGTGGSERAERCRRVRVTLPISMA